MFWLKRKSLFVVLFLAILFLFWGTLLGGCAGGNAPRETEKEVLPAADPDEPGKREEQLETVKVVTTIFPLAEIIRQVGGEGVEVTQLLPAGASPHTYEPSVEQARAVAGADLVIFIGGGLDNWAVKLAEGAPRVRLLEIMPLAEDYLLDYAPLQLPHEEEQGHDHDHAHGEYGDHDHGDMEGHQHHHGPYDPHLWLDPLLVRDLVAPLVETALSSVNPDWQELFKKNLSRFQHELTVLHEEIAARVALFRQRRFISYHSAWNYYAHRYGLEEVAAVEEFPGKEPSARWMAELIKLAARYEIKVLFAEPQLGGNTAEVIAQEIGGEVLILDPLGGPGIPGRDNYFALLHYNTEILARAME